MESDEIYLKVEGRFCLKLIQDMANMQCIPEDLVKRAINITKASMKGLIKEGWIEAAEEGK